MSDEKDTANTINNTEKLSFDEQLNFVLSQSYGLITAMEKQSLNRSKRFNLSLSELKTLDVISRGKENGRMIGDIALDMYVTASTATIAVTRLAKKGMVYKERGKADARQVYVKLTEKGSHAVRVHKRFHRNLANSISKDITEDERRMLIKCIYRMNEFMEKRIKKI